LKSNKFGNSSTVSSDQRHVNDVFAQKPCSKFVCAQDITDQKIIGAVIT